MRLHSSTECVRVLSSTFCSVLSDRATSRGGAADTALALLGGLELVADGLARFPVAGVDKFGDFLIASSTAAARTCFAPSLESADGAWSSLSIDTGMSVGAVCPLAVLSDKGAEVSGSGSDAIGSPVFEEDTGKFILRLLWRAREAGCGGMAGGGWLALGGSSLRNNALSKR